MGKAKVLVCGVGVNDADYFVSPRVNGSQVVCKFYICWYNMLFRCYKTRDRSKDRYYAHCSVCDEWHRFMSFREWMAAQDWVDKELDKDLIIPGNKIYSPETCAFVTPELNKFLTERSSARGDWPLGVQWSKSSRKFITHCNNPFSSKEEYLGLFDCPEEAHVAWRKRKHELALIYASQQADPRIAEALSIRYLPRQEISHD